MKAAHRDKSKKGRLGWVVFAIAALLAAALLSWLAVYLQQSRRLQVKVTGSVVYSGKGPESLYGEPGPQEHPPGPRIQIAVSNRGPLTAALGSLRIRLLLNHSVVFQREYTPGATEIQLQPKDQTSLSLPVPFLLPAPSPPLPAGPKIVDVIGSLCYRTWLGKGVISFCGRISLP